MNTEKPCKRQRKTCECGQTFWTTAKFGNETLCDACHERSNEEFMAWFDSQPTEYRRLFLENLEQFCIESGVPLPDDDAPVNPNPMPVDEALERLRQRMESDGPFSPIGNIGTRKVVEEPMPAADDARQSHCDAVAASLLADLEI